MKKQREAFSNKLLRRYFVRNSILGFAELFFRYQPVNSGFYLAPTTKAAPVAKRLSNPEATTSVGAYMRTPVRSPINNEGFVNRVDYFTNPDRPLLAIIGDSFIEAANVPQDQTCHGVLQNQFGADSVYSFAMSGAPLSQYLIWANYARQKFSPDAMAFVIIFNDFDESYTDFGLFPGYHYFSEGADGNWLLRLREFRPS